MLKQTADAAAVRQKGPALGRTFTFFAATLERLDRAAVKLHEKLRTMLSV